MKSPTFKFEGETDRYKKWFVLKDYWLKTNFMKIEKLFYEDLYCPNLFVKTMERTKYFMFQLVIQRFQI